MPVGGVAPTRSRPVGQGGTVRSTTSIALIALLAVIVVAAIVQLSRASGM
jgi:hypothetical protein